MQDRHLDMDIESSSPASPSPQDTERLLDRFFELEANVDAFSTALARLSDARGRRLGSSSGTGGGIADYQVHHKELFASGATPLPLMTVLYPVLAFVLVGAAAALVSRRMRKNKVGIGRDPLQQYSS